MSPGHPIPAHLSETNPSSAKRYERLLKAHDATPKKAPADGSGAEETPAKKTKTPRKRGAAKISKAEPVDDEDEDVKDEYKDDFSESEVKSKKKKGKRAAAASSDELDGESALLARDDMSMLSLREIPWAPGSAGAVAVRGGEGGVVEIVDSEDEEGEEGGVPPPALGVMPPPPPTASRLLSVASTPNQARPTTAARRSLALPPTFPHHLTSSRHSLALPTSSPSPFAFGHTASPSPINTLRPPLTFPTSSPSPFLGHMTTPPPTPSPSTTNFGNNDHHHHHILPRHHHGRFYSTANISSFAGQRTRSENPSRDGLPPTARMSFGGGRGGV